MALVGYAEMQVKEYVINHVPTPNPPLQFGFSFALKDRCLVISSRRLQLLARLLVIEVLSQHPRHVIVREQLQHVSRSYGLQTKIVCNVAHQRPGQINQTAGGYGRYDTSQGKLPFRPTPSFFVKPLL